MNYNTYKKTIVVDCGKNSSTFFDGNKTDTLSHKEVLNLPNILERGSLIISEYAHLGVPRTLKSLSQPFTAKELYLFYAACKDKDITLKLFPQKSTPRAIENSNLEKDDETDPQAIYNLVKDFPRISLMNPPESFELSSSRQEGFSWKRDINTILNHARSELYQDKASGWIRDNINIISDNLSEEAQSVFNIVRYKKANQKLNINQGDIKVNDLRMPQMYSILATLQGTIENDSDGGARIEFNPRLRQGSTQRAGWSFIKRYVLCMSPFHLKGGVARSNLYYHGLKNWVIAQAKLEGFNLKGKHRGEFSQEEDEVFVKYRARYVKAMKDLFFVYKSILDQ